jgi:hypothetical protein
MDYLNLILPKMLKEIGIPSSQRVVELIIKAQQYYFCSIRLINEAPRMSEICQKLKLLTAYGKRWAKALEAMYMDEKSLEKLGRVVQRPFDFSDLLERALGDALIISTQARLVLEDWRSQRENRKSGAPFDFSLRVYISELARIYEGATGKRPPKTKKTDATKDKPKFPSFVKSCLDLVPGRPRLKAGALASAVERALANPSRSFVA